MFKKSYIIIVLSIFLIDLFSKYLTINFLNNQEIIVVPKFFTLTYVKNFGISFSMFNNKYYGIIILSVFAIALLFYMLKNYGYTKHYEIPLLCMIAGALGNFSDRIFRGYVVDMISLHFGDYSFAIFNIADSFVVCGCIYLIIYSVFFEKKE